VGAGSLTADAVIIRGAPITGFESQIGVWRSGAGSSLRAGKRYRIYPKPAA
jgi:hypothetical protein